ncbi:cyclin-dependent kinase [Ceratobasidium sp. AG-Ba]|nr:cyclin-dependent kinase [Ceratobasidium sp. AG-Ba]
MAMVSPWMDNGDLLSYIERNPKTDRCKLLVDISKGVTYLHKRGAIHGDIKSGNILISSEGVAKLADFGCTQTKWNTLSFTTTTGSPSFSVRWAAPEVVCGESPPSKESDVYALGMTLLEAITGKVPFHGKSDVVVLRIVAVEKKGPERPPAFISFNQIQADSIWEILSQAWAHRPTSRPKAKEIHHCLEEIAQSCMQSASSTRAQGSNSSDERPSRGGDGPSGTTDSQSYNTVDSSAINLNPPSILKNHYPSSFSQNATTNGQSSYGSIGATTSTTIAQPPIKMPSPEPWRDPAQPPPRRGNPDDAAMMAHVRALEEARKLQEGDIDDSDEESIQRKRCLILTDAAYMNDSPVSGYVTSKFGDQSGQVYGDDSDSASSELTLTKSSSSTTSSENSTGPEREVLRSPFYPFQSQKDLYHPDRDRNNYSRETSDPIANKNPSPNSSSRSLGPPNFSYRPTSPWSNPSKYDHNNHHGYDEYDESLENEPINFDEIPDTLLSPPSISSPAPGLVDEIPVPYVGAPRTPNYEPQYYSRPPPLSSKAPDSGSRWYPSRSPGAELQPSGLPGLTGFDAEHDSLKHKPINTAHTRNQSRSPGRGYTSVSNKASSADSGPASVPTITSRMGPGVTVGSFGGFTVPAAPAPAPILAPVASNPSSVPLFLAARNSIPRPSSRAGGPSPASSRPVGNILSTPNDPHSVPKVSPKGSPSCPEVVASKPPPSPKNSQPSKFNPPFKSRYQNKTAATVQAFQAMRENDARVRDWLGHESVQDSVPHPSQRVSPARKTSSLCAVHEDSSDEDSSDEDSSDEDSGDGDDWAS